MKILSKENKALLSELVRTDFKLRYQGSVLGYMWSLLKPLLLFCILYVVFVNFLKMGDGIEHYPTHLLIGLVLWNFFTEMTMQSLGSIVSRGDLIRKIHIPRWMIVFSSSVSASINLAISLVVVLLFIIINGVHLSWSAILFPIPVLMIYLFSVGCSYFLAALFVRYRDVVYIWEVVLQAGFYATPIIYPLQLVKPEIIQKILLLNPLAMAIQDARYLVISKQAVTIWNTTGALWSLVPITLTAIIAVFGIVYFKKRSRFFAEEV